MKCFQMRRLLCGIGKGMLPQEGTLKYNMNELMYNVWPWDTGFEIVPQYNEWQTSPGRVVNAGIKPGCSQNAWESGTQTRVISNGGTLDWVTRLEWHNGTGCVGIGHRLAYNGQDAGSMLRQSWVKTGGRPSQNAWYGEPPIGLDVSDGNGYGY